MRAQWNLCCNNRDTTLLDHPTPEKLEARLPRIRDLITLPGQPGPHNAMTDVPGVRVGQTTLHDGHRLHTGVTTIVPPALPTPANLFVGNGYGKLIGATQLVELGEIETPILLTSTLSAFRVADALVSWMLAQPGNEHIRSLNPVVGETNDGYLSDIRARPITVEHVRAALDGATTGPIEEGAVGAGAGTVALGFKGGIGTSSRRIAIGDTDVTIGALVQSNFGGILRVRGQEISSPTTEEPDGNSCMIVIATDAPLDARQLGRLSRRAVFAMDRVGANFSHGSGDYAIAFTTGQSDSLAEADLSPIFTATMDAVEEALLNSLFMAETVHGIDGHVARAVLDAYPELITRT